MRQVHVRTVPSASTITSATSASVLHSSPATSANEVRRQIVSIGFTFLVPAYLGSPGQRAVKRVCLCGRAVWQSGTNAPYESTIGIDIATSA